MTDEQPDRRFVAFWRPQFGADDAVIVSPVTHRPLCTCERGAARIGPCMTGKLAASPSAFDLQSVRGVGRLSTGFRGLIEAPIPARIGRAVGKDVAVFRYQPRGGDHGPAHPAGARISSTQAGRNAHGAFAQHDLSVHQGRRISEARAARAARGPVARVAGERVNRRPGEDRPRRRPAVGVVNRMHGCRRHCNGRVAVPGNGPCHSLLRRCSPDASRPRRW